MADCRVDWTVNTSRTNYTPPGLSSYTFGLSSDADRMPELDITRSLTGATSEKGFNYVKVPPRLLWLLWLLWLLFSVL